MHQFYLVTTESGKESLTVFLPGGLPVVATDDHPQFPDIVAAAKGDTVTAEEIRELADLSVGVANRFDKLTDRVMVSAGRIYLDGDEMKSTLTDHILRCVESNDDFMPLVLFLENLLSNPEEHSRDHLYVWLEGRNFQITEDGCVICYKGVGSMEFPDDGREYPDCKPGNRCYGSWHNGPGITDGVPNPAPDKVVNYVGATVEMARSETTHDPTQPCATGLHVGTFGFATSYGDTKLTVKVNPRDVISVPNEGEKMRVQRYVVLDDDAKDPRNVGPIYATPPTIYRPLDGSLNCAADEYVAGPETRIPKYGDIYLIEGHAQFCHGDHGPGAEERKILVPAN